MTREANLKKSYYSAYQLRGLIRQTIEETLERLGDRNSHAMLLTAFVEEASELLVFEEVELSLNSVTMEV